MAKSAAVVGIVGSSGELGAEMLRKSTAQRGKLTLRAEAEKALRWMKEADIMMTVVLC
jgi:hypothetical protein